MRSEFKMGKGKPGNESVRAKKALGQHFLTDLNIARRIAEAVSGGGECVQAATHEASGPAIASKAVGEVLEIGGGMGVLTQFLLERDDIRLWGIEVDRESIAYMREHFASLATSFTASDNGESDTPVDRKGNCNCDGDLNSNSNSNVDARGSAGELTPTGVRYRDFSVGDGNNPARLIEGDFLKFDLRRQFPEGVKIVGNFPYNISSQIFFKVLENRDIVPEVVGMLQREVAQRIAEPPGSRTYGILSVLLQAWYDIEYLFTVSEGVFSPPPKVKSAVIRLTRNGVTELGCDEVLFVKVVKAAFGQRRKMLRNALRAAFGDFGGAEHPFFSQRAERLSVAQFVELTDWVARNTARNDAQNQSVTRNTAGDAVRK